MNGNKKEDKKTHIRVCHGHRCTQNMSKYVFDRAVSDLEMTDDGAEILEKGNCTLGKVPCQALCQKGPNVVVEKNGRKEIHSRISPVEMGGLLKKLKVQK